MFQHISGWVKSLFGAEEMKATAFVFNGTSYKPYKRDLSPSEHGLRVKEIASKIVPYSYIPSHGDMIRLERGSEKSYYRYNRMNGWEHMPEDWILYHHLLLPYGLVSN